ncbi:sensor histidine kinase YesM [Wenyingzhuangia heitensis]|uniref:Sensor histidine kinase YesM n=1 Tax=Wenyingzhuangia heitensis TaxID=1487859 RepID=A0ABX0U7B4_9FLAO|nr:histidine kinase [Wenyingzhuangia heitensis]NIJ44743.1 sensor histidine kinase YesM [Wenyingzhuangia heitensis]
MNTQLKKSHIILIHLLVWILLFSIIGIQFYLKFNTITNEFFIRTAISIGVFYFNYLILIPYLLLKRKIVIYIITLILFYLTIVLVIEPLIPLPNFRDFRPRFLHLSNPNSQFSRLGREFKRPPFLVFLLIALFLALSTSTRLIMEWYKKEKERVLIASQKVTSELSFLRTQLNPHFLFNTLNSIYSLANKKSDDTTTAIVTLSELMRYMIYEVNEELVPLKKETAYIQNYIDLHLLRLKDSSGIRVNIIGDLNYKIEPLLLISFIENAFKYGTDFKGNTDIQIKISVVDSVLHLYVHNTLSIQNKKSENSGIGLNNIKNRLNLLYPKNHELTITQDKNSFKVYLSLKLKTVSTHEMYNYRR